MKCISSDYLSPPPTGTVLSVGHLGYYRQSQKLKHPFLLRARFDLNWDEVVHEKQELKLNNTE